LAYAARILFSKTETLSTGKGKAPGQEHKEHKDRSSKQIGFRVSREDWRNSEQTSQD
jgi:hypothetical protein